jgi:glycine C-acetyltransferase
MVDEAHALGVLGQKGHGLCAREGVRADLLMGTLGKAFGCSGAFASGAEPLVRLLENRARSYVFSTAPPPALAEALIMATELVEAADQRRAALLANAAALRASLQRLGYSVPSGETPIIPVRIGAADATMKLSAALLARDVFAHGVRPPTVPPGTCRLRVTAMATHTSAHIHRAVDAFTALAGTT